MWEAVFVNVGVALAAIAKGSQIIFDIKKIMNENIPEETILFTAQKVKELRNQQRSSLPLHQYHHLHSQRIK